MRSTGWQSRWADTLDLTRFADNDQTIAALDALRGRP